MKTKSMERHLLGYGHHQKVAGRLAARLREEGFSEIGSFWMIFIRFPQLIRAEPTGAVLKEQKLTGPCVQKWAPIWAVRIASCTRLWPMVEQRVAAIVEAEANLEVRERYSLAASSIRMLVGR